MIPVWVTCVGSKACITAEAGTRPEETIVAVSCAALNNLRSKFLKQVNYKQRLAQRYTSTRVVNRSTKATFLATLVHMNRTQARGQGRCQKSRPTVLEEK